MKSKSAIRLPTFYIVERFSVVAYMGSHSLPVLVAAEPRVDVPSAPNDPAGFLPPLVGGQAAQQVKSPPPLFCSCSAPVSAVFTADRLYW